MKSTLNIDEEQKIFKSSINKKTEIKRQLINSKTIIFSLYAFMICFLLYLFFFCFHFELKSEMIINKENWDYDEFAKKLFKEKKILSFDYLNEYYYRIKRNYSNFDNIHLLLAFNNEYYLLASVTITSILKTANKNSFIHIHIITSKGFEYETMKKLNSLW